MKKMIMTAVLVFFCTAVAGVSQAPVSPTNRTPQRDSGDKDAKRGTGLNAFPLGNELRMFYDINKNWPQNKSHMGFAEERCVIYSPKHAVQVGDFLIPADHIYLVFYQDKLMRIRVVNPFTSWQDRNLQFFNSTLAALTQKYGQVKSSEPLYNRYDGKYEWKTAERRVTLTYAILEYGLPSLEAALKKAVEQGKNISPSDL